MKQKNLPVDWNILFPMFTLYIQTPGTSNVKGSVISFKISIALSTKNKIYNMSDIIIYQDAEIEPVTRQPKLGKGCQGD